MQLDEQDRDGLNLECADLIETTISSEEVYHGVMIRLERDTVCLPNGNTAIREVMRHPGAAAVVPLTREGNVVLVRQFRYPFSRVMLEIPAGKLDPNEAPADCARRELQEETGFLAEELISLGVFFPSIAMLDEQIHLFLARGLTPSSANLDEDEFLHVEQRPLKDLVQQILRGEVPDGKTQTAILKAYYLLNDGIIPDKQTE